MVDLDVLAGGDVALVQRRVLLDDAGEGVHLLGGDAAEGKLDADHLDVGLALAVDALFEAEADELVLRQLAGEELLGFVVEVVELALDDRDDVAGDVLVGLRVLEGADPALAPLLLVLSDDYLHGRKIAKPDRDSGIYFLRSLRLKLSWDGFFAPGGSAAASPDSAT